MQPETTPHESNSERTKSSISIPAAIISGAVVIAIALIIVWGPKQKSADAPLEPTTRPAEITSVPAAVAVIRANDRIRGDATKAEVAIIEYSDSDCPFCTRFHTTMQQISTAYGDKVAWVYRYFPLTSLHPNAVTEAVALECVAELGGADAFNKYLDTIINVTLNPDPKSNEALTTFATGQGIDKKLFESCIKGTAASDRVKADIAEAGEIGAQGTPFSIAVNLKTGEQIIIPGAYPFADVKADIDSLLK